MREGSCQLFWDISGGGGGGSPEKKILMKRGVIIFYRSCPAVIIPSGLQDS